MDVFLKDVVGISDETLDLAMPKLKDDGIMPDLFFHLTEDELKTEYGFSKKADILRIRMYKASLTGA